MLGDAINHGDPIAPVILGVTGILFFALIGRFTARKFGMPSVLGELLMGVLLGNLAYYFSLDLITVLREGSTIFDMLEYSISGVTLHEAYTAMGLQNPRILEILEGPAGAEVLQVAHTVDVFSRYGVIFLLFLVGLDTSIGEMRAVGPASFRVAFAGAILPFMLGIVAVELLMDEQDLNSELFIAATLAATSIGITAQVLREMGKQQCREAKVVLGAAVIDDILGLILLAIVTGIVVSGSIDLPDIGMTILLALAFIGVSFWIGPHFLRQSVKLISRLDVIEAKMFLSYMFVMVLAWFANLVGMATIIGAFTAGVIISDAYFKQWHTQTNGKAYSIKDLIMPLEVILVPIFFVLMGLQVKLETLLNVEALVLAVGLIIAAIIGKIAAGYFAGRGYHYLSIGMGMLPRGEVGLIFASIGRSLGVIDDMMFSAVVIMVVVTTFIAPPLIKARFKDSNCKS